MKIAFLMQCHKNPEQINLLLKALKHPQVDVLFMLIQRTKISGRILRVEKAFIFYRRRIV